jgi:transcriptional regulator with XRE-family HTH domain
MMDMASFSAQAWGRLGDQVRRRRTALRMKQSELAAAAEVSVNTIVNIEKGSRARQLTLPAICRALGWSDDSAIRILDGEAPEIVEEPEPPKVVDAVFYERPPGLTDADWDDLKTQMDALHALYTRLRRD